MSDVTRGEASTYFDLPPDAMRGRVAVVTGATRGIGLATAAALARLGAAVVLLARDRERGEAARASIAGDGGDATLVVGDLASLRSVRAAAAEIAARIPALHALVHNAGVSVRRRTLTEDGIETTLAVNHVAPALLTRLLLPSLRAGAPSRVVSVSSEFERWARVRWDDLQGARVFNGTLAYVQSKRLNVLYTYALAARLAGSGVTANCVYPGLVATDLLREHWWWRAAFLRPLWRRIFRTPAEGALASVHAAASPALTDVTGRCFAWRRGALRDVRTAPASHDRAARERLWELTERLIDA